MYHKKYKFPCYAVNLHVISFPVRHTDNFRFDGRHCICDLMAHAMLRKLCSVDLTGKARSICKPKFQKKATNFVDKTVHKNSFSVGFFIWVFGFQIDIFVNGKIETSLKSHCVVKLPVDDRLNNFRAKFLFHGLYWIQFNAYSALSRLTDLGIYYITRCGIWLLTIFHIPYIHFQREMRKVTSPKWYLSFLFSIDIFVTVFQLFRLFVSILIHNNSFTVIQRRMYGNVNFTRSWRDYVSGFGNQQGDFWLGLSHIYYLTSTGMH